jgi:uncharacterized phiE125 gp8 family phage protein
MPVKLITPAAVPAVSLTEAKAHLRVTDSDHDADITALCLSAQQHAEVFLGRCLVDTTWDLYLDSFPSDSSGAIKIPKPPLIEVQSVSYFDGSGTAMVVDPSDYYVDAISEPGWVVTQGGATWPTTLDAINAVHIRFRAGYLDTNSPPGSAVPEDIKAAIKLMLGSLYETRETQAFGRGEQPYLLPWGAEQLLRQHRIELSMA